MRGERGRSVYSAWVGGGAVDETEEVGLPCSREKEGESAMCGGTSRSSLVGGGNLRAEKKVKGSSKRKGKNKRRRKYYEQIRNEGVRSKTKKQDKGLGGEV